MEKLTNQEKLLNRKIKKPPYVIYNVLGKIWKNFVAKKYNVTYTYKADPRKEKGSYIVLSNHASRMDYIFTGIPLLPHTLNFVAGYNEFFRSHLKGVFKLLQVIPKKNFTPDYFAIKSVSRVIKKGGRVVLYPEGMNSISGGNQPCAIGGGKFVKHFKVPVYFTKIRGGYLTSPKFCLDERYGKIEVTIDKLFDVADLEKYSAEELQLKIDEAIKHDDYAWNKERQIEYVTEGSITNNMEDLLYACPKCHEQFKMVSENNKIYCTNCGNGAYVDNKYNLTPLAEGMIIPDTPKEWFDDERRMAYHEIQNPDFVLEDEVDLGIIPKYEYLKDQKTSEIVGKGILRLTKEGITYKGTREGQDCEFFISIYELPTYGMCTDTSRFYTFYKSEFVEFYPKRKSVIKWLHATEEMHRFVGGKWKNFSDFDYEDKKEKNQA